MWNNNILKTLIKPSDSVLDLGCGHKDSFKDVKCAKYVGVDLWEKAVPDVIHDLSITPYPFASKSFDIVTAIDCIEHLDKLHGHSMLHEMNRIAKRLIVIFTPDTFRDNANNVNVPGLWSTGNTWNTHKSLWSREDFDGWKFLNYVDPGYIFCYLEII